MPAKRRRTLSRSPILRAIMWDKKMDAETYSEYLQVTKPLALTKITEYQALHETLISMVKSMLEKVGRVHETHQYMWYTTKLYKLTKIYSGEALNKEATIIFLEYLIRGLNESILRAIALTLGIKIGSLADILEKQLSPLLIKIISQGTIIADGTEQTLLEYVGDIALISGYINLSNMREDDKVIVSSYIKLTPTSDYVLYHSEVFSGQQTEPALYVHPRLSGVALKVTLRQVSGIYKSFEYLFVKSI
uniref:Uncharacterized protein n=1 Tax=Ignisphaera aggregans TaxID=334771 RepID=A0A7J3JQ24_9CREN